MPDIEQADALDWTHAPRTRIEESGGMRCQISVPSMDCTRQHTPHLLQTLRMEPITSANKPPPLPDRFKEQIIVKEADLKRFGTDLKSLRECQLPTTGSVETAQAGLERSFKSEFAKRCSTGDYIREPWKNMKNPELYREPCEQDLVLNQVWVDALPSRKRPKDLGDVENARPPLPDGACDRGTSKNQRRRRRLTAQTPPPTFATAENVRDNQGERRPASQTALRSTHSRDGSACPPKATVSSRIQPFEDGSEEQDVEDRPGSLAVRTGSKQQCCGYRELEVQFHYDKVPRSAWLALCPCNGHAVFYPKRVAERLEAAFQNGRASVPLAGLGKEFEGSIVNFATTSHDGAQIVETSLTGGQKEVQRIPVPGHMKDVQFYVTREDSKWRFVPEEKRADYMCVRHVDGELRTTTSVLLEERRLPLSGDEIVSPQEKLPPVSRNQRTYFINEAASEYWG